MAALRLARAVPGRHKGGGPGAGLQLGEKGLGLGSNITVLGRDELPGSDLLQPLLGLGHVFDLHVALGDVELVLEPEAALNCLSFQKVVERLLRPPVRDVWSDNRDRKRACAFDPRCGPHHHAPKKKIA